MKQWKAIALFLGIFVSTEVLSNSTSRFMGLADSKIAKVVAIAAFSSSTSLGTHAMMIQAKVLPQTIFWPIQIMVETVFSAITGIIVWEDWKVVGSWGGYVMVMFLFGLGTL